jgi:hypothetical protein
MLDVEERALFDECMNFVAKFEVGVRADTPERVIGVWASWLSFDGKKAGFRCAALPEGPGELAKFLVACRDRLVAISRSS